MDGEEIMQGKEPGVQDDAAKTKEETVDVAPEKKNAFMKFMDSLFGGNKEADPEQTAADPEEEKKTFTQEELDAAVEKAKQDLLAEEKEAARLKGLSPEERAAEEQKKKDSEIADLRNQLLKKELQEAAAKTLEKDGFPTGLADILDYSSKERMEETLGNTTKVFKECLAAAITERLRGKTPEGLGSSAGSGIAAENLLREQIKKSIRGV